MLGTTYLKYKVSFIFLVIRIICWIPSGNLFPSFDIPLSSDLQDLVDRVDGVHGVADAVVVHQRVHRVYHSAIYIIGLT